MRSTTLTKLSALAVVSTLLVCTALAQTGSAREDGSSIRNAVEQYLRVQTAGLPGTVAITVGQVDQRLRLAACASLESFLPAGSKPWGKTTVGVRCAAPDTWTVYVQATVRVMGPYVAVQSSLTPGQTIGPGDITTAHGDLTSLPAGVVLNPSQAIGRVVALSIPSGSPVRTDALRVQTVVQQGQTVRLISSGLGFEVSAEAKALTNAVEGQVAQARTPSGQLVSGVAKAGGIIEVPH